MVGLEGCSPGPQKENGLVGGLSLRVIHRPLTPSVVISTKCSLPLLARRSEPWTLGSKTLKPPTLNPKTTLKP